MTKILIRILSLAIAGAVFFIYTRPTYDILVAVKAQASTYDAGLAKARELQELRRSLLARYNTFPATDVDRLAHLLPDHVDNVRLVLDIDSMATRYNMAIQNVVIDKKKDSETTTAIGAANQQQNKYDALTLQFSTRATYANFVSFIEDLESSLRIVDTVSLSVEAEPVAQVATAANAAAVALAREAEPMYRFNITIRTYWLK